MATLIFGTGYLAYKQVKKHRGKKRAEKLMIANTNSAATDPKMYQNFNHELDPDRTEEEEDEGSDRDRDSGKAMSTSPRLARRTSDEIIHGRIEGLKRRTRDGDEERRKSEGNWRDQQSPRSVERGDLWEGPDTRDNNLIDFGREREQGQQEAGNDAQAPAPSPAPVTVVRRDDPTGWVDEILREKELEAAARMSIGGGRPPAPGVAVRQVGYTY